MQLNFVIVTKESCLKIITLMIEKAKCFSKVAHTDGGRLDIWTYGSAVY